MRFSGISEKQWPNREKLRHPFRPSIGLFIFDSYSFCCAQRFTGVATMTFV